MLPTCALKSIHSAVYVNKRGQESCSDQWYSMPRDIALPFLSTYGHEIYGTCPFNSSFSRANIFSEKNERPATVEPIQSLNVTNTSIGGNETGFKFELAVRTILFAKARATKSPLVCVLLPRILARADPTSRRFVSLNHSRTAEADTKLKCGMFMSFTNQSTCEGIMFGRGSKTGNSHEDLTGSLNETRLAT